MWHIAALSLLISGPGSDRLSGIELPHQHQMDHNEHRGSVSLNVSGEDGGRTLNKTVYGFLPYWGDDTWLRYDLISVLACFCVDMGSSGTITAWNGFPSIFTEAIEGTNAAGGTAIVTVVNFSSYGIHSILTTNRDTAINTIVDLVNDCPVEGVSIDFENVSSSDRDNLTAFMFDLRAELDAYAPGSHLSICTPPVDWGSAFDYSELAEICNALFMMCYPFHGSWSSIAGPCCPLTGWGATSESSSNMVWCMGDYAKYAPFQHDKIVVGLPYYGHQWETEGSSPHSTIIGNCSTLFYTTLVNRAETYGRLWDNESLTPWYAFYSGIWNQGWYDDEESLSLKYDMIREADFQGTGIWALGYDGSRTELWDCLEESFCGEIWTDNITDNLESRFTVHGPEQYWCNVTEGGQFYGYFYTYSISTGPDINWAEWTFELPDSSLSYMLDIWLPEGGTAEVSYRILHDGVEDTFTIQQSSYANEWVPLGGPWNASEGLSVITGDYTGTEGHLIVIDAIRFSTDIGIEDNAGDSGSSPISLLSGNPSSMFALNLSSSDTEGSVLIYDTSGRLIFSQIFEAGISDRICYWPTDESTSSGVYTAVYLTGQSVSTVRLVLIR
ncbi:MAG: hypothetical protein K8R76_00200 [Candidatus Aegiribacteria sp.]|nr:hypothetical protein [Candidatus Aegiribacteria sp.]